MAPPCATLGDTSRPGGRRGPARHRAGTTATCPPGHPCRRCRPGDGGDRPSRRVPGGRAAAAGEPPGPPRQLGQPASLPPARVPIPPPRAPAGLPLARGHHQRAPPLGHRHRLADGGAHGARPLGPRAGELRGDPATRRSRTGSTTRSSASRAGSTPWRPCGAPRPTPAGSSTRTRGGPSPTSGGSAGPCPRPGNAASSAATTTPTSSSRTCRAIRSPSTAREGCSATPW